MNELVNMLVSQLGVNEGQAQGGAGLLLNLAKQQLGHADFSKVAEVVPGAQDLIKSAPQPESGGGGLMGMVGSLASSLGGGGSELGQLAGLVGGFEKLGLKPEMLAQFAPIVLNFVENKGGGEVADLLKGVLGDAQK